MSPPPSTQINSLIIQFMRQHMARIHALMDEIGVFRGQPPLLNQLWANEGCTQSELAENMAVSAASVTKMLQRMEQAGLIERRVDALDQRVTRVYLTPAGWAIREQVQQREQQIGEECMAGFSAAEREQLGIFLERMRDNLQAINNHPPAGQ